MRHTETSEAGNETHRGLALSDEADDPLAVLVEPAITITQDVPSTRRADTRTVWVTSWDQFDEMLAHLAAGETSQARRAFIRALNQQ